MYRSFGAVALVAVVFDTPLAVAKERNTMSERVVPEYVLDRIHAALTQEPVSIDEGFDEVITVI